MQEVCCTDELRTYYRTRRTSTAAQVSDELAKEAREAFVQSFENFDEGSGRLDPRQAATRKDPRKASTVQSTVYRVSGI